jgi:hypothetical protein
MGMRYVGMVSWRRERVLLTLDIWEKDGDGVGCSVKVWHFWVSLWKKVTPDLSAEQSCSAEVQGPHVEMRPDF